MRGQILRGHTSSLDLASARASTAGASSSELSFRDDTSSSGNAPLVVKSTSARPTAPPGSVELIVQVRPEQMARKCRGREWEKGLPELETPGCNSSVRAAAFDGLAREVDC